jgi:arsenate reductase (glutaredoxin)
LSKIKVYHNPRCSKSRCAIDLLKNNNIDFEVVEYLKQGLSITTIQGIVAKLNTPFETMFRKNEEAYKKLIKGKNLQKDELLTLLIQHPELMERPIFESDKVAVVARPAELILSHI